MSTTDGLQRAPGRGHYNREATPSERVNAQRTLLLQSLRRILVHVLPSDITVTELSKATGLGRNTLYGHFPSVEAACGPVVEACWQELQAQLDTQPLASATPISLCKELSERWFRAAAARAEAVRIVARCQPSVLSSQLAREVEELWSLGAKAGAFSPTLDPVRIRALSAGLFELIGDVARSAATADHCANVMAELLARGLR